MGKYYRKAKSSSKGLMDYAMKKEVKKEVKAVLAPEMELKEATIKQTYASVHDTALYSVTGASTNFFYDLLSNMVQGVGSTNAYVGEQIWLRNIRIRLAARSSAHGLLTSADEFNQIRLIIFQYHPDSGIDNPSISELLDLATVTAGEEWNALYNYTFAHKFKILKDKTFCLNNMPCYNGTSIKWEVGLGAVKDIQFDITKGFAHKVGFTASNNAKSKYNGIFCVALSDSTGAPDPTMDLYSRVEYTDA